MDPRAILRPDIGFYIGCYVVAPSESVHKIHVLLAYQNCRGWSSHDSCASGWLTQGQQGQQGKADGMSWIRGICPDEPGSKLLIRLSEADDIRII